MSFASPAWLAALALVPLVVLLYAIARRRARRYAVRFPATSTVKLAVEATPSWRRHLPAALMLAAITALAVALARPQVSYRRAIDQASIVLVTDHSGSMASTDVQPSRLAAAEQAANTFIDALPDQVRLGAVAFSSSPDGVQSPAADHSAARAIINAQVANGSTATGNALALALSLLHATSPKHPPSAIVLLSDGAANAGENAVGVAQQAKRARIPIYTVALGTPSGTLPNPDPLAPPQPVPPDPQLMQQIAAASGGRAFNAQSADQLGSIYQHLGNQLGSVAAKHQVTAEFAAAGLVLLVLGGLASSRWMGRLP